MTDEIDPMESMTAFFAYELKRLREEHDLSQDELAGELITTRASVTAYETLARRPGKDFAVAADKRFGTGRRLQIIWHHSRKEHESGWLETYLKFEREAYLIMVCISQAVHAFLQTEAYARALMAAGHPENLDALVAARLARKAIPTRKEPAPPECLILLDQAVILRSVGGVAVMREQLAHILEMSELPNITVQIVPFSAGSHLGLNGDFRVLGMTGGDVAYCEAHKGGRLIFDPAEVVDLRVRWGRIRAKALSEDASLDLIAETMRTLR